MGRHKYIPQFFCLDCGTEIFPKPKGQHRKYCPACAKERIRVYHNLLRKKQWREDPVYRAKSLANMKAYQERIKLKIVSDQLKGTSEI